MQALRYAEDYREGETFDLGAYEVTRDEIVEFAARYDPFPFHLSDEAARSTPFGGIISSGWMTALVFMRMMHKAVICVETALGSPGNEVMKWPAPVRPGDRLQGRLDIKESRVSRSRPELGFVRFEATLTKQTGEAVFFTAGSMIVKSRGGGGRTPPPAPTDPRPAGAG